ncbi:GGDEF domain-containing protein [Planctomycetota bacterium]
MTEFTGSLSLDRVLIIGNAQRLFWDVEDAQPQPVCISGNVLDGIHQAAGTAFAVVALEMREVQGRITSVLRALHNHTDARIVLLAQMYEEPIARRFIVGLSDKQLADDYLVCPASLQWLMGSTGGVTEPGPVLKEIDTGRDILETRIRQLERLATEDDLTGLKNRRYVWEFARQILEHAERQDGRVTLLVYDIDNFKHYNDRFGHATGDRILKEAAKLMRQCCRTHDVVGRIGGDEFAVIFWDDPHISEADGGERRTAQVQHPREAVFIAQRFQAALKKSEQQVLGPRGEGVLTISGGLASFPEDGTTIELLFEKADNALLKAKRSGKDRVYLVGRPPQQ